MAAFQMESNRMIQISIIWIGLLFALSNSQHIPKITNLDCYNDFDKKMFCYWEVNSNSNCSEDFQLKYTNFEKKTSYCRDLDNEHDGGTRLLNKCICNLKMYMFIAAEDYKIEVKWRGTSVANTTIYINSKVKLKAPSNVRLDLSETENAVVYWDSNYEDNFIRNQLSFQVQFICKQDNRTALEDTLPQLESRYRFSKRQLKRGYDYMVRVRTKPAEHVNFKGIWSEWSNPKAEWRNDYSLTLHDLLSTIIPVSCIVIIFLVISFYLCFSRYKNRWWNNIPDPGKSNLAQLILIPKKQFKPDGKSNAAKTYCGNFLSRTAKNDKSSKHVQLTQRQNIKDYSNINSDLKKLIFEPENENIESCVEIFPKIDNENIPSQEDVTEDNDEDHLLGIDFSISKMFCDILCDSSAQKMETLENHNTGNTFGNFGCPSFMGHCNEDEARLSEFSPESGYHSYDSDNCLGDFSTKLYEPNTTYSDKWSGNQKDFLPYAPPFSLDESCSHGSTEVMFVNSGYNSFANALAEDKLDSSNDTAARDPVLNFCLDCSSQSMSYKPNHNLLVKPNSIYYYNTHFGFVPFGNEAYPTKNGQRKVHNHGVDAGPTSVSEVSGCQDFGQAVQQSTTSGNTMCPVFDSGYKPFESLVSTNNTCLDGNGYLPNLDNQCNSVHNHEEPQQVGMVPSMTHHGDDTESWEKTPQLLPPSDHLSELSLVDLKNRETEKFSDEHRNAVNKAADIQRMAHVKFQDDIPFALTFDICDHLRNFTNMYGHKFSLNSSEPGRFHVNIASFPCCLNEATIIPDHHAIKKCFPAQKCSPLKFQNVSYFLPLYDLRAVSCNRTTSHLLLQPNNLDKEGNPYMKIAL
ncbi:interleukin-4 receptor subunit alpha-like [Mixophyes fleayi]|uniref:interleukin-4 receptor subunit alpha-like n=1 Tax=Mixophyes fleayi TaxID=3061075 RepID=UPI003F4E385C